MPSERLGIPRALRRRAFLSLRQPYSDFALGASDDTTIVFPSRRRVAVVWSAIYRRQFTIAYI
jgi:hypothetical protein